MVAVVIMGLLWCIIVGRMLTSKPGRDARWHDHGMKKRRKRPDGSWETRKLTAHEQDERRDDLAW